MLDEFSLIWLIPFFLLLFSIALCPILMPKTWHKHDFKIILSILMLFLLPFFYYFKNEYVIKSIAHAIIEEYIPFIILIVTLFIVSNGIAVKGNWQATPLNNSLLLLIGGCLASIIGTTGASILMIKPIIMANLKRSHRVHVIVFFIFIVGNIGGGLTPLGDPPLFLGFLRGVSFGWTIRNMLVPVFLTTFLLLIVFYCFDYYFHRSERIKIKHSNYKFKIFGKKNIGMLVLCIIIILITSVLKFNKIIDVANLFEIKINNWIRDISLLSIAIISYTSTPKQIHTVNQFNLAPIYEIMKIFIGIFITIIPVISILNMGSSGCLGFIFNIFNNPTNPFLAKWYFLISGMLSAFLDNAPTYLIFFNLASGNANHLMENLSQILIAISMGTVFMGAMTYIGNAPNLIIKNVAHQYNIPMPHFFGYMRWSVMILLPTLLIVMFIVL